MSIETSYYTQKKDKSFILSIAFLTLVIILSVALYGGEWYFEQQNTQINKEIAQVNASVKSLESDKKLQILDLVRANKITLETLAKRSQITTYISHLKAVSGEYDVLFEGFNYANGTISTKGTLKDNEKGLGFVKLSTFISKYRETKENPFNLSFISSVTGQDQIEANLDFKLK